MMDSHVTAVESKVEQAPTQAPARPAQQSISTNPYLGILGVFLGAGLATLNARLVSVGLADLRGALGLGFDEASWIPTALNMATMFSGVFVVFLNAFWGPRRILLPAAVRSGRFQSLWRPASSLMLPESEAAVVRRSDPITLQV
jgi:DHA2 family multidrug resistance protein